MRIIEEEQLDFDDLLICPKTSGILSRSQVNLEREFKWWNSDNSQKTVISFIPYGPSNMGTIGTCAFAKKMVLTGHIACLEKHIPIIDIAQLCDSLQSQAIVEGKAKCFYTDKIIPSIGLKDDINCVVKLYEEYSVKMLMIDCPNGYIPTLAERIRELRSKCPNAFIIAGNVVDSAGANELIKAGAKCVKAGIGNGSCCRTRVKTGVGRPQASTLIEVADYAHQQGCYVMCDGGCNTPGDICKAFGCGADIVISGSLFAGCDAADGDVITIDGKKYKQYYGMSSHLAQEKHFGGIRKYSASEGIEKLIPYTGTLDEVLQDIDGGIKSCMTYIGCSKMKNFNRHTTFYKVHKQFNSIYENCKNIR